MFNIISDSFFVPLASPNKTVYWECICKLFTTMDSQLFFGVERDVLVDELTRHKTVAEIMDALFNDYITNIVDKAYHRLLTSDNVSKFRPEIIDRLESKSRSRAYVEKTAAEIAGIREIPVKEAEELVYHYLHQIIDAFQNMDEILKEINQKNTQYQRSAVNRARFMLTGSEDVRGQLKEILLGINEQITSSQMNLGGIYRIGFLEELVRIYSVSCLDEKSFYSPIEGKKEFKPAEKELLATQLPLESTEDFIKIIYIRLYGQRKYGLRS